MQLARENREIRVFLSSTFRDMQFERDYLIKKIFPEVRQACRERRVEFTEIDLRWGVTEEEAMRGDVVRICLEEIDQCRPYFLGLMGERYGWQPVDSDLGNKNDLVLQFPFVESSIHAHKSVTEMEILHGVLESSRMVGHALFYLRAPELTETLANKTEKPFEYFDTDIVAKERLATLKNRIKQSGHPVRENYTSIEALGEQIKSDLLDVLNHRYPKDKIPTHLETERLTHQAYADDRCQAYIPSPNDISALDSHIETRRSDTLVPPLVIGGESGLGKSALLAYVLKNHQQANSQRFLIQHFTGVSGDATPHSVLRRIMQEIKLRNQEEAEIPTKPEEIIKDFPIWLAKVRANDRLLLVIDAINQIEGNNLSWLPSFIPPNVTLIVSALPGTHYDQLKQRSWQTYTVQPLDDERRQQLIQKYLKTYRKRLSKEQTQKIASAQQCGNPLFLITLLEELRVFGVFEQLDARIADYLCAQNPAELFSKVLQRMETDYCDKNQVSTVPTIATSIWAARKGLTETELLGITGLNRQDLSIVLLAMDYHLSSKNGLRNFFHDHLRQAVRWRYLNSEELRQDQHRKLAEYFDRQLLNSRKVEELPWQWQQAQEGERLRDCLTDIPVFEQLYDTDQYELLAYWLSLGSRYDIGSCYTNGLAKWEEETSPYAARLMVLLNKLGMFIYACGFYDAAEPLFRRALSICETVLGHDHPNVAAILNNLAGLLKETSDYAGAEPLHLRALSICQKVLGPDHPDTARSLNNLALLLQAKGDYAGAEPLYRRALVIYEKALGPDHPETARILNNLALLLQEAKGDYAGAEPLYQCALSIREKSLGPDHPDTAHSLNNLAFLLQAKGDYAGAEPLCRRALAIHKKALGSDHPETAIALSNLATLLHDKGDYASAEPLHRLAMSIREKSLGPDHPDTALSLNNLAFSLQAKGDYAGAEPLYRRALMIYEKALGTDHPDAARSLNNLAEMLREKGDYVGAEPLCQRALLIYEKSLGQDHPDTARSLNNLGLLLQIKGDYAGAEPLYRRALAIYEITLGPDHPNTALNLNNLAALLQAKGNYAGAEPLYRRALAICEKSLGSDHPDTARSLNNLAELLKTQGDYASAEPLYRRALAINGKTLGSEHPKTATSLSNLASLLQAQGNYAGAESLYRRALSIQESQLGAEHLDIAVGVSNLASILEAQGDCAGAEQLYQRALSIYEKALGPDHPDTTTSLNSLAWLLQVKGDYEDAERLYRRTLSIREKSLGPDHPDTVRSLNFLALLLQIKGDYDGAELLYRHALAINEKTLGADHPDTAASLNSLVWLLEIKGDYEGAEPRYRRVLEIPRL